MEDEIRSDVKLAYPRIASELLEQLLNLLIVARNTSGGDVDRLLILMVVALHTTEDEAFKALSYEDVVEARLPHIRGGKVTAMMIADTLGASKETVRRKVLDLIEQGWLQRNDGRLRYTPRAFADIAPVRNKMLEVAVAYHGIIGDLSPRASVARQELEPPEAKSKSKPTYVRLSARAKNRGKRAADFRRKGPASIR